MTSGAFSGLSSLESLDLSGNYVRRLDSGALCPPDGSGARLRHLILGHNELTSLSDVGGMTCLGDTLASLDLSFNRLELVGSPSSSSSSSAGLGRLGALEELRLNNNHVRNLKGDVLRDKPRLRFIDLSNNNLVRTVVPLENYKDNISGMICIYFSELFQASLPEELFTGSTGLRRLSLANNSLAFLPGDLFRPLSRSLEVLDLSGNLLASLESPSSISVLGGLTSLDLSHNRLAQITSVAALRGLSSLRSLRLDHNRLSRLPVLPLPALTSLVLSHNELSGRLSPSRIFHKTPALSHLLLDHNRIEDLPRQVFGNTTALTVLDLSDNRLRGDVPEPVRSLRRLQSFAISHNFLERLSGLRLPALWRLQAAGNKLSNLSSAQLEGLPALQVLDLSENSIGSIEKGAFEGNKPLEAIRLDDNRLVRIDGLFHALPNLSWLNVSANQVRFYFLRCDFSKKKGNSLFVLLCQ